MSKGLSANIFGLGEVESCNLVHICSISWAMDECISMSVSVSFRKWSTFDVIIHFSFIHTRRL